MDAVSCKPIEILKKAGYEAFLVGGCVRDMLMGRTVSDTDITTNALPDEIHSVFFAYKTLDIGIKHGTVTVLIDGTAYEITTYRAEAEYTDHRHPGIVRFGVSLREDLARRDFTVNAIAYDGVNAPIDPFGGMTDIEHRIIRCVGNPEERFEEDALRILRGLRFSATLGFAIEDKTLDAMLKRKHLLSYVSAERIWQELSKLIVGKEAARVILEGWDVLSVVLPELAPMHGFDQHNYHHIYDVLTHTAVALEHAPSDLVLRMAILLHDCAKPSTFHLDEQGVGHFYGHAARSAEFAEQRLTALKVDTLTKKRIVRLIAHHDSPAEENLQQVVRKMRKLEQDYPLLVALRRADNSAQAPQFYRSELHDLCEALYKEALQADEKALGKKLSINGCDLLENGALKGKNIGILLSALSDDVLDGKVQNQKEILLAHAKERYGEHFAKSDQ